MSSDDDVWWVWIGAAGGAWVALVCVVMVMGSMVNMAVLVHWFTTRPPQDSPAAALPFIDLVLCSVAAPLRYINAPPFPIPRREDLRLVATEVPDLQEVLLDSSSLSPYVNDTDLYAVMQEVENVTFIKKSNSFESIDDVSHIVVVCVCLTSLHVVVIVALHRVALLLQWTPTLLSFVRVPSQLLILSIAGGSAVAIVGSLESIGQFTEKLPLLGMAEPRSPGSPPPPMAVGFLIYIISLCGTTTLCYAIIITTLLYQRSGFMVIQPRPPEAPQQGSYSSSVSSIATAASPGETEAVVPIYSGQERTMRACLTVASLLVTLNISWGVPSCLALYSLLTEMIVVSTVPYCDVLPMLTGLVHPFQYGEGLLAIAGCLSGIRHTLSAIAYRVGLTKSMKSRVQMADHDLSERREREERQEGVWTCLPCRSKSRLVQNNQLFSEVATFVNSFPLRHARSRQDPEQ